MHFKLLDNTKDISKAFADHFVMTWDEFQIKQKDWIAEMAKTGYSISAAWYEQSYMWDKMDPAFPRVSMEEALAFLREHSGSVFFMTEKGEDIYYQGKKSVDFIAEADAHTLAEKIEQEWHVSTEQNTDIILPDDLFVFDSSMKWCAVFTHETTDWDPLKAAENRYCIICKAGGGSPPLQG